MAQTRIYSCLTYKFEELSANSYDLKGRPCFIREKMPRAVEGLTHDF